MDCLEAVLVTFGFEICVGYSCSLKVSDRTVALAAQWFIRGLVLGRSSLLLLQGGICQFGILIDREKQCDVRVRPCGGAFAPGKRDSV